MDATRLREPAPSSRVVSVPLMRPLRRGIAVVVLVLCLMGATAGPAGAGAIVIEGSTLAFVKFGDDPNRPVDVTFAQSGGQVTISSVGDLLVYLPTAPCVDVRNYDIVACDLSGIDSLAALGGAGDDRITVQSNLPATLCGGDGNDTFMGGAGDDLMGGAAGDDSLIGGPGVDLLRGDRIHNSAQPLCTETLGSPPGANTLEGGPGADQLVGDDGSDTLRGGAGDDQLFGRSGDDKATGEDGDDALVGLNGDDTLEGGRGVDVLSGGLGRDLMRGGDGNDDLGLPVLLIVDPGGPVETSVELGNDRMEGGVGSDKLFAGAGDRTLNIGLDAQRRAGGRNQPNGADLLLGGSGTDEVSYINREIPVSVTVDGQPDDGSVGEGDNVASDIERITGGTAGDVIQGGPRNDLIEGGPGSDRLGGLDGADTLDGGLADGGTDVLSGGPGPDSLSGGPGADGLAGGNADDELRGGGGADRLDGEAGADDLQGEADADNLVGGPGADVLDGGPGTDRADYGRASSAVRVTLDDIRNDGARGEDWIRQVENLSGGAGADSLFGNAGANIVDGGRGHDLIDAAQGKDRVNAGPGRDAVLARDGARDAIACGADRDAAVADELDTLAAKAERCERADRGGPARSGEVLLRPRCGIDVRLPGIGRSFSAAYTLRIPRGTLIDASRCAARLFARRRTPLVRAIGGTFVMQRAGTRRQALRLALSDRPRGNCRTPTARRVSALSVRSTRHVRLIARFSVSEGTRASWTVDDRCGSTVTRVKRGTVRITERRGGHEVVVRAPRTHVSKPSDGG